MKVQIFNNLATISISKGKLDEAKELLHSAEPLSRKWTKSLDRAATLNLLATLCVKNQDWEGAESYLKRAIEIRRRTLSKGNPLVSQTTREYADVLRHLGKEVLAQNLESDLEAGDTKASLVTAINPPKIPANLESIQTRTVTPRSLLVLLAISSIVALFPIVNGGLRAAEAIDWIGAILIGMVLTIFSIFKFRHRLRVKTCEDKLRRLSQISAIVSFRRLEHSEMTGGQIFVASLEAPFNRKMLVKEEFGIIRGHLYRYCQPNEFKVVCDDNKPVAVVTPDGPIEIIPWISESEQDLREKPATVLAWTMALLVVLLVSFPLSIGMLVAGTSKDKAIPEGLTPFEYYRLGVNLSANAWKGSQLIKARDALNKASILGGHGIIARLASSYAQSELPKYVPPDDVLNLYDKGLTAIKHGDDDAKLLLESCLKNAPLFEWPYAILAELSIDEKNYGEAQKLLDQAKAINPEAISYLLAQAKLEEAQGNRERAYSLAKQAIEDDPFKMNSYWRLAHLLFL